MRTIFSVGKRNARLTHRRIAYAKELLKDRMLRIMDIALVVGYETAIFRKVAGLTPSEFRRRL